jgi:hypothetical protein
VLERFYRDANTGVLARTFVTVSDMAVAGFISLTDAKIRDQRYFLISNVAVSLERRGSHDFLDLLNRAAEVKEALEELGKRYVGDAILLEDNLDLGLARLARAAGFRRVRGLDFWVRGSTQHPSSSPCDGACLERIAATLCLDPLDLLRE